MFNIPVGGIGLQQTSRQVREGYDQHSAVRIGL
jgi:hypothetical protein